MFEILPKSAGLVILLVLTLSLSTVASIREAESSRSLHPSSTAYDGPIFDVHVNAGAMNESLLRTFMSNLEQVGVRMSVLSGWDESVDPSFKIMRFKQMYPDRIIPSLYFGLGYANTTGALVAAEHAYEKGFRMFGELLLKHDDDNAIPADDPNVLRILDIAAKRHIPVLVHHDRDYDELERALEHNQNATIIFHGWRCWWTRCDFSPNDFKALLTRHHNLIIALDTLKFPWVGAVFVDQSTGVLRSDWKELFEDMPYRFVVGSDFADPEKDFTLDSVSYFANFYRGMLGQLNPVVAKRLAYQNLEDLFAGVDLSALSSTTQSVTQTSYKSSASVTQTTSYTSALVARTMTSIPSSSTQVVWIQSSPLPIVAGVTALVIIALVFSLIRRWTTRKG